MDMRSFYYKNIYSNTNVDLCLPHPQLEVRPKLIPENISNLR